MQRLLIVLTAFGVIAGAVGTVLPSAQAWLTATQPQPVHFTHPLFDQAPQIHLACNPPCDCTYC